MIALDRHEHEPAGLVQGPEADPVLGVERRLPEGEDHVSLARGVELEMGRLAWLHHAVLVMLDEDEVLKAGEVDGVGSVLLGLLVVHLGYKLAFLHVSVEVQGVMPVLSLNQEVLDKVHISPIVKQVPRK